MKNRENNGKKTWKEVPIGAKKAVEHEPWPGYRLPFYLTVASGTIYLVLVFSGLFTHG